MGLVSRIWWVCEDVNSARNYESSDDSVHARLKARY